MARTFDFEIIEVLAEEAVGVKGDVIRTSLISFNGGKVKVDIRRWFVPETGDYVLDNTGRAMGKGISLDPEQVDLLTAAVDGCMRYV